MELNKFLTLHFSISTWKINIIYFIAQKIFLLNILEAVLAYDLVKIRFIKGKEVILNGNTNDKSRGIQLIGPGYLQKVIKGVNWLLSPIASTPRKDTPLRKHAYSNILDILPPKNEKFQLKILIFLLKTKIGSSNEYPQSMFLSRNKKNNVYPCKPQFYYIKVGFKGVKII